MSSIFANVIIVWLFVVASCGIIVFVACQDHLLACRDHYRLD